MGATAVTDGPNTSGLSRKHLFDAIVNRDRAWQDRAAECYIALARHCVTCDIHLRYKGAKIEGRSIPFDTITVEFAEGLGICDFAPAALADDGRIFGPLDPGKVDSMIEDLKR